MRVVSRPALSVSGSARERRASLRAVVDTSRVRGGGSADGGSADGGSAEGGDELARIATCECVPCGGGGPSRL